MSDVNSFDNFEWNLGTIQLWFKEGTEEGSNLGLNNKFQAQEEIIYQHEDNTEEKNAVVRTPFTPLVPHSRISLGFCDICLVPL